MFCLRVLPWILTWHKTNHFHTWLAVSCDVPGWSLLRRDNITIVKRLQTLPCRSAWSGGVEHLKQPLQGEIISSWLFEDIFSSEYGLRNSVVVPDCWSLVTRFKLQRARWHGIYFCCSWWRWRAPMTGCPRSSRSGWTSFGNWGPMWKCVMWPRLEPEELVWSSHRRTDS